MKNTLKIDMKINISGKTPAVWPCYKIVEASAKIAEALAGDTSKGYNPFALDIKIDGEITNEVEYQQIQK